MTMSNVSNIFILQLITICINVMYLTTQKLLQKYIVNVIYLFILTINYRYRHCYTQQVGLRYRQSIFVWSPCH